MPQEFVEAQPQSQDLSDTLQSGIARTRSTDTAGVGRGTSVVTGNRRRTAIRVGLAGRALRTAVVRRTAIGAGLVRDVTVGIGRYRKYSGHRSCIRHSRKYSLIEETVHSGRMVQEL